MEIGDLVQVRITRVIGIVTEVVGKYILIVDGGGRRYSLSEKYVEVLNG